MTDSLKKKDDRNILPLINKSESDNDHALLKTSKLKEEEQGIISQPMQENQPNNGSVWPVEPNLLVETARFENNVLHVTFTNLSVEPIKIESMGVKYTSIDTENIDFQPVNITLPTGESVIQIPCPRGNPFKFVVRTTNKTGSGSSKENMNW
tara:strand:- start:909 stop:1364 length:456 start_codon:yes stop_codon:yes gene_type:complete